MTRRAGLGLRSARRPHTARGRRGTWPRRPTPLPGAALRPAARPLPPPSPSALRCAAPCGCACRRLLPPAARCLPLTLPRRPCAAGSGSGFACAAPTRHAAPARWHRTVATNHIMPCKCVHGRRDCDWAVVQPCVGALMFAPCVRAPAAGGWEAAAGGHKCGRGAVLQQRGRNRLASGAVVMILLILPWGLKRRRVLNGVCSGHQRRMPLRGEWSSSLVLRSALALEGR